MDFLRAALGKHAVAQPEINIGSSFSAAANAAFGATLPVAFTAYGNDALFLLSAFIFEDVGVTAYKVCTGGSCRVILKPSYDLCMRTHVCCWGGK